MNITDTATVDPTTCTAAILRKEATRLSVPNRSKLTTEALRVAVAAEQMKWAELDATREDIDTVLAEAEALTTTTQDGDPQCVQADLHKGVGTCACGWTRTSTEVIAQAQAEVVAQRNGDHDTDAQEALDEAIMNQPEDEPTTVEIEHIEVPAPAQTLPAPTVRPVTRGVINTSVFRAARGCKPSTLGDQSWTFHLVTGDGTGRTRVISGCNWYQAAAILIGSEPQGTRWTLVP